MEINCYNYFSLLVEMLENETNSIIKRISSTRHNIDKSILNKESQYYSLFKLVYLIIVIEKDIYIQESIIDQLIEIYFEKYEIEKEESVNRLTEYLAIMRNENIINESIKNVGSYYAQKVVVGIDVMLIVSTDFAIFVKGYADLVRTIVSRIKIFIENNNLKNHKCVNNQIELLMENIKSEIDKKNYRKKCPICKQIVIPTFHGLCPNCDNDLDNVSFE